MIPARPANGILIDRSSILRMLVDDMMTDNCIVKIDDDQWPVLLRALDRVEALGDIDFQLQGCVDHRPGYLVRWTNGGNKQQDAAVDEIMRNLIDDLGFAADIKEPAL